MSNEFEDTANPEDPEKEPHSDWEKTIHEHTDDPVLHKRETSSPGALNESGMPVPEQLVNKRLGSGIVAGHLGSGGMGDVYKIWNEQINRFHAVKLLRQGSSAQVEKRFEREIKVTATFDHPNIIHVYGAGHWKGYLYLEMEFVEGRSLDILLQQKQSIPPVVACAIGIQVTQALHYAHHHSYTLDGEAFSGVIHRDLKPSNIILADDGRLKLMDFGIAKPMGGALTALTMGNLVGSWIYMPPEQLDGCSIDLRADIYTFGEVLYELITGKPPFTADNQRKFIDSKVQGRYPPVEVPGCTVPGDLVRIIDRCMKVNPDARFQTAIDVGTALRNVYGGLTDKEPDEILATFVKGEQMEEQAATISPIRPSIRRYLAIVIIAVIIFGIIGLIVVLLTGENKKTSKLSEISQKEIASPHILTPRLGDTLAAETLLIAWKRIPDVQKYLLHVATDQSFRDTVILRSLSDTTYTARGIRAGEYRWRVGSVDDRDTVAWSGWGTWIIKPATPPVPGIVVPMNNQKGTATTVQFIWYHTSRTESYHIQVASDQAFERLVFDSSGCYDTALVVTSFNAATTYFWRVCGERGSLSGAWSSVNIFSTAPASTGSEIPVMKNYGLIAVKALHAKRYPEAEAAVLKLPSGDPRKDTLLIRCAAIYVEAGMYSKAKRLLTMITSIDKYADLLRGRVLIANREYATAYKVLDMAITAPTLFKSHEIEADILYYRAVAASASWVENRSAEKKSFALNAWKEVRNHYKDHRTHPRYRQAAEEATKIAD